MSVLVIAEPGCTHEGDKATLLKLLETAHQCGANVWKPQWTSDPVLMCERRNIGPDHPKRAYYEKAYSWLAFPFEWHTEFLIRCHRLGMQYACTAFLPQDVPELAITVDYLKVSSFEATDPQMRAAVEQAYKTRVLISRGMCSYEEGIDLEDWARNVGAQVLHCVSSYPAPMHQMNLRSIADGLSDHSRHLLSGALAVAMNAELIETHYRLDTCHPTNPDFTVAFSPAEFAQYITNIRDAETLLGEPMQERQASEAWGLPYRVTV